jgi:hypothetical protein
VHHVQEQHSDTPGLSLPSLEHPLCPECGARMSQTAAVSSGSGILTFACSNGHHLDIAAAEADPMKSDAIRWLAAHDLKSPN